MKYLKQAFILFLINSLFTQCSDDPLQISPDKAVVQGYLKLGQPIDIYISKEAPFSDTTISDLALKGLSVEVETNGQIVKLKDNGNGHYTSESRVDSNKTYHLRFDYGGKKLTASTFVPVRPKNFKSNVSSFKIASGFPPSFPDPLKLEWTSEREAYYLIVAENTEASPEVVFSGGPFGSSTTNNNSRFFRQSPFQGNSTELQSQLFRYYGNYHLVLFRINAEYASLYTDNGNSSLSLTTPYTNITNGLGIFTGMSSDTLAFNVNK